MRKSTNINQSVRRVRANDQPRLTTPFRHRITAFRYRTVTFGTILLDSMANQCASGRTCSCANQRALRAAVPDDITNNGARARPCGRARASWRITRCQTRSQQRYAADYHQNLLNHKYVSLAIKLRRKRVVAYSATFLFRLEGRPPGRPKYWDTPERVPPVHAGSRITSPVCREKPSSKSHLQSATIRVIRG